jgi:hypothetical protein
VADCAGRVRGRVLTPGLIDDLGERARRFSDDHNDNMIECEEWVSSADISHDNQISDGLRQGERLCA